MEKRHIFYSWQSDSPNNTNRGFIEDALEKAIKILKADDSIEIEPVLDRDTLGEPGAIHIAESVFSKIERAKVFVGDVSIIGIVPVSDSAWQERPTPNPNVLVEFGYALKTLRHTGVLMVMNTAFGKIEELPFDLDRRRVIPYEVTKSEPNKADIKNALAKTLALRIKEILDYEAAADAANQPAEVKPLAARIADAYAAAAEPFRVKQELNEETDAIIEKLNNLPALAKDESLSTSDLTNFMREGFELTENLIRAYAFGCFEGGDRYNTVWAEVLTRLGERVAPARRSDEVKFYPSLLCFYAGGIAAVAGEKYETLAALFHKTKLRSARGLAGFSPSSTHWLIPARVIDREAAKSIPAIGRYLTPLNQYLYDVLREPLREAIPNEEAYDEAYLRFEYLFALGTMEIYAKTAGSLAAPEGSYIWENWIIRDSAYGRGYIWNLTAQEIERDGEDWHPLRAEVFKMTVSDFREFKQRADAAIIKYIRTCFPEFTGEARF